ncbi:RNA/RNP complex-1-interacting phosphatase homolog [Chelonus insularis]|uniref:RNA/RNP complex-1-interacting phosphatase homolog n=1 Tax=Chelonus insularis TaxID=460826 RepID=UPI00158E93E7|nr:RNA/RNP complex-1-interacting phosphatase homolog [Chelonus insularis]
MPRRKSVPDAWLDYKPYGSVIDGTRFLAFKVPLSMRVCQNLPTNQKFTPELLMKEVPNLKYIIDLTNTNRYYNKTEFTAAGIQHFKIMITGGEVPKETKVREFCRVMDMIVSMAKDHEIIGVHCTHGINRTGYLICKYLIKVCGWDCHSAIKAFESAREHNIRRMNYIQSLLLDSKGPLPYVPSSPTKKVGSSISSNPRLPRLSLQRSNWRNHPPPPPFTTTSSSSVIHNSVVHNHRSPVSHPSRSTCQRSNWRDHPPPPPFHNNSSPYNSCNQFNSFSRKHQRKCDSNRNNNNQNNESLRSRRRRRRHDDLVSTYHE